MLDVSDDDAKVILDPGFIAYSDINHNREQKPIDDGLGKKKKKKSRAGENQEKITGLKTALSH